MRLHGLKQEKAKTEEENKPIKEEIKPKTIFLNGYNRTY